VTPSEVQVNLNGRIHPRTAPRRDAWPSRLSCLLGDLIAGRARLLASAATPVGAPIEAARLVRGRFAYVTLGMRPPAAHGAGKVVR
jgi:hypothetical protein